MLFLRIKCHCELYEKETFLGANRENGDYEARDQAINSHQLEPEEDSSSAGA